MYAIRSYYVGITFILTGLMAIGFMSFGGMLTGGDEAPKKEVVENITPAKEEIPVEVVPDSTAVETVKDSLTEIAQN